MPNTYRKTNPKGVLNHIFETPLYNFQITTGPSYTPFAYNIAELSKTGLSHKDYKTPELMPVYTKLVTSAAKLLSITELIGHNVWEPAYGDALSKAGWTILKRSKIDKYLEYCNFFYDLQTVDISNLTIDKLVGKDESKAFKKILDGLEKEGPANNFDDAELAGPAADEPVVQVRNVRPVAARMALNAGQVVWNGVGDRAFWEDEPGMNPPPARPAPEPVNEDRRVAEENAMRQWINGFDPLRRAVVENLEPPAEVVHQPVMRNGGWANADIPDRWLAERLGGGTVRWSRNRGAWDLVNE